MTPGPLPILAALAALASSSSAAQTAADADGGNPCTNGSFEDLSPAGFPSDWAPLGRVEVSSDAATGSRAVRLVRTDEPPGSETGLNRIVLIRELSGGMRFAYKAVSSGGGSLRVYAIPVNAAGLEKDVPSRAVFTVPAGHVGDGLWHRTRVGYDFRGGPGAAGVHFAARIEGGPGELLLDDVAWVPKVGAVLRLGRPRVEEPSAGEEGRRFAVAVAIENAGDEPAASIEARIDLPPGLRAATEPAVRIPLLGPGRRAKASWTVEGPREGDLTIGLVARSGAEEATSRLRLEPGLEVRSAGPAAPAAIAGEPVEVQCALENAGTADVLGVVAVFGLAGDRATRTIGRLRPGETRTLAATFAPGLAADLLPATVEVSARNCAARPGRVESSVAVAAAAPAPPRVEGVHASCDGETAVLENGRWVRLAFRKVPSGFGPAELSVLTAGGWTRVAWLDALAVHLGDDGVTERPVFATRPPTVESPPGGPARLVFSADLPGGRARLTATYEVSDGSPAISTRCEVSGEGELRFLEAPVVHVLERDEALFPGVEWLVGDEVSSSALDIAEGHPDRIRHRPHPNWITIPAMCVRSEKASVGLLWDPRRAWDGERDRPGACFVSPDRVSGYRAHRMSLFVPSPPEFVRANTWRVESARPYALGAGKVLSIEASILVHSLATDVLDAVDHWIRTYGLPEPAPLPRVAWEREVEFSMNAYLHSLWVPEELSWWTTKGGGSMSGKARPREFVADLLLGEILSPTAGIRRQCRERAEEVLARIGGTARLDAQRWPASFAAALANPAVAAEILSRRGDDGAWRFDADQEGQGPFVGLDYHDLGPDGAVEVGTCARNAYEVLRYARIAGDLSAYEEVRRTLQLLEGFRVPRAAQVWEVPLHSPDILAAADAVDCYLEAYRCTGEERWLRDAIVWARRGLPFVYLWSDPERPFLAGATIPVYGATWLQGSWFGRPVQWNGLRYASALLGLAEHDRSFPWRWVADLVVRSALWQQDAAGRDIALWPDNLSAIDSEKCAWVFGPRMILQCALKLLGRDEDPVTVSVADGRDRIPITAAARIEGAARTGYDLRFRVAFPRGEQGIVLVSNVGRPERVLIDGVEVERSDDANAAAGAAWSHSESLAALSIRVDRDGPREVEVLGAPTRVVERLARRAERIEFGFERSAEGWMAAHQVVGLEARGGELVGTIAGPDPYLVRGSLRVRGDDAPVLVVRMRVDAGAAGTSGQLYWSTASHPGFSEDRVLGFALRGDGELQEVRLEPGRHPLWAGEMITAIRLDPANGAPSGTFGIDRIGAP